ncbi:PREDICTED: uncharacterized protein LOC105571142, partial [Vollenhovia emeryi]|uniref:uncharacterized protein LOC105571142 n=1 Tax=Vollenhovia emeryi TaxID=411798 RepID=UPI0005F42A95
DLFAQFFQVPRTEEDWLFIAKQFDELWNCPHTLGAIDGKHVIIQCPIRSGSEFFSYKEMFSIVLFALVDANYNFMFVDVGCQGRISDGGVFANTELYNKLETKSLRIPQPTPLVNGSTKCIPYFIIGDEAFALTEYLMKVYPGFYPKGSKERIYNYRICRARRIVENVFGTVSSVFRVLRKPVLLEPEKAELVVMTIACLHNFLRRQSATIYTPPGTFDYEENGQLIRGSWRALENKTPTSLLSIRRVPRKSSLKAKEIRQELTDYFVNEGRVEWQEKYA